MSALTGPQRQLLDAAKKIEPVVFKDGSTLYPGLLVSGRKYATACALERRGLGTVRYQGPALGWFHINNEGANA